MWSPVLAMLGDVLLRRPLQKRNRESIKNEEDQGTKN